MMLANLGFGPRVKATANPVDQPPPIKPIQVVGRNIEPGQVTRSKSALLSQDFEGGLHLGYWLDHRNHSLVNPDKHRGIIAVFVRKGQ